MLSRTEKDAQSVLTLIFESNLAYCRGKPVYSGHCKKGSLL